MPSRMMFLTDISTPSVSKISVLALSLLFTSYTQARPINTDETINTGATPEDFIIGSGATLTVNNATTLNVTANASQLVVNTGTLQDISANNKSTVTLNNATVVARAGRAGVTITNSNATITDSTITSDVTGLQVARVVNAPLPTVVDLIGSSVTGGATGAVVSATTVLNLRNSNLTASSSTGMGLRLTGGDVFAVGGSIVGGQNGVQLGGDNFTESNNQLVLDGTRVEGVNGAAISVAPTGRSVVTEVQVLNGADLISGNGNLLEVGNAGKVNLTVDNSALTGNVQVDIGATTNVVLQNNSSLTGNLQNISSLLLNNKSSLTGDVVSPTGSATTVSLDNRSTLTGNLQNVASASLDHLSVLKGDIVNEAATPSSVLLDGGSTLEGQIVNSSRVAINNQAQWNMTGSNQVNSLVLNGGTVRFADNPAFSKLDVANLSGSGVFAMRADLVTGTADFLNVTGTASGNHQLQVTTTATGNEPTVDTPVQVGHIAAGDAAFSLSNGPIDAGAFTYKLLKEGEGLFLTPDKETVSTGTNAVLAIAGTAQTVAYGELSTLNSRLGDRRLSGTEPSVSARSAGQDQTGVWMRTYGNRYNVANAYGDGYSQTQQGVSVGADAPLPFGDGQWLLGGFGGYSKTDLDLKRGSSATIDSYYLGGYLTWYDAATGYYVDTVAKVNQFDNSANVTMSDGTRTKGDYKNLGLSGSVEVGKHIELSNSFFVEPFTQVAAAVFQGKDYTLDNGLSVSNDNTRSLLGKVGATVGREIALDNGGKLQPRVKAAVSHEFVKNNVVSVNDNNFNNDLATTSLELGAGINWTPARKSWQVYAEVGSSKGKTISQDWSASAGLSYSF